MAKGLEALRARRPEPAWCGVYDGDREMCEQAMVHGPEIEGPDYIAPSQMVVKDGQIVGDRVHDAEWAFGTPSTFALCLYSYHKEGKCTMSPNHVYCNMPPPAPPMPPPMPPPAPPPRRP